MKIFKKLFRQQTKIDIIEPNIQFGRYSDANKKTEKYEHWDLALEDFENEKYMSSYIHFLEYLKDDSQHNVTYSISKGVLTFEILQGSKIIDGRADHQTFRAIAKIVSAPKPPLPLMRSVLESNYELKFIKYAIDDDSNVTLVFDTLVEDSSPHKLYQALRELATEADRKDEYFIKKYEGLAPVNIHYLRPISDQEKTVKYNFIQDRMTYTLAMITDGPVNGQQYPGAISYLILDALYTVDFLVKPEGYIREIINRCHESFFQDTTGIVHDKNRSLISKIKEIKSLEKADVEKELNEISATFGHSKPEGITMLFSIIKAQENDLLWYHTNFPTYTQSITSYLIGYSLYNFSLPDSVKSLLKIYYQVLHPQFFEGLGFSPIFHIADQDSKEIITSKIKDYSKFWQDTSTENAPDPTVLSFDTMPDFCKTFIEMILNMEKTD